jgi:hypothetical protein
VDSIDLAGTHAAELLRAAEAWRERRAARRPFP